MSSSEMEVRQNEPALESMEKFKNLQTDQEAHKRLQLIIYEITTLHTQPE